MAATASGQTYQRRAALNRSGIAYAGSCTIEVVVDGAAEIEIRGENASIRDLSGRQPQWRRFECTGGMPPNADVQFHRLAGRGSTQLISDPRNGGAAVIRINDPQGGPDTYAFELTWGNGGNRSYGGQRHDITRWDMARTIGVCEQSVREQAMNRFRTTNISFRHPAVDNNPGPQDWVTGIIDVRQSPNRVESYQYSCSVNFETGRVRSMRIEPFGSERRPREYADSTASGASVAIGNCERAAEERIRREGYDYVDFGSLHIDDRPGRRDSIVGSARAEGGRRRTSFDFSCSVDLANGRVRSVNLNPR
ncbi:MAG TPA: hypothetical protein VL285_11950 [Bryobacteraceae bacterium]|nr:hypothetical protein [Bryobacteraceae bacterium]